MASVSLERVTKIVNGRVILDEISLDVQDREFFCVIGPSGCGKTFLLRTIAGLERPERGVVRFDGQDVTHVAPHKRNVAMVFQSYALYPHLKARGNIGFPLHLMKVHEQEIDRQVVRTAEELGSGLVALLERRPRELAVGHQQRVAVGRAVIKKPQVYLFDEPLSNLDAKVSALTRLHLKRLFRNLDTTVVYVTPDDREAFALADRMAVMSPGRIEQISTPQGIWSRPANLFVAEFIHQGAINVYRARLDREEGRLHTPDFSVTAIPAIDARARGRTEFVLGVMPDHVHLEPPSEEAPVVASIDLVEALIAERKKKVHLRRGTFRCIAEVPADLPVARGDYVGVDFDLENALLFEESSGRTLY